MSGQVLSHNVRSINPARSQIVAMIRQDAVSEADIATLRSLVLHEAGMSADEAEALFALECAPNEKPAEWTPFFVEAITDFVVWQVRPTGVVNEPQGEWLIGQADRAASVNALAALVNVLAEAHRVPGWLEAAVRERAGRGWRGVPAEVAATLAGGSAA